MVGFWGAGEDLFVLMYWHPGEKTQRPTLNTVLKRLTDAESSWVSRCRFHYSDKKPSIPKT